MFLVKTSSIDVTTATQRPCILILSINSFCEPEDNISHMVGSNGCTRTMQLGETDREKEREIYRESE